MIVSVLSDKNNAGVNPNTCVNTLIWNHLVRGRYRTLGWGSKGPEEEAKEKDQNGIAIQSKAPASYGE